MIAEQPYQHKVIDGFDSPEGWLIIIQDTMKPKPHIFSLPSKFHIMHTSREHHGTQDEVNRLIKAGKINQARENGKKIAEQIKTEGVNG